MICTWLFGTWANTSTITTLGQLVVHHKGQNVFANRISGEAHSAVTRVKLIRFVVQSLGFVLDYLVESCRPSVRRVGHQLSQASEGHITY